MMNRKINIGVIPKPTSNLNTTKMCKTCAYRSPSSEDEDEMTKMYWMESPLPHPCHEKQNGTACYGCLKTFERLGLKIDTGLLDLNKGTL